MIDVNWDLAPDGAVAIKQDCGKWKKVIWVHADGSWWNDNDAEWNPEYDESKWVQTIAVRPVTQTKTVADAEQEGEKWTHTYNELKCRTLIHEPDREGYIVIVNELNEYYCVDDEELKPIKPTISESEAISIMKANRNLSFAALLEDYDVVKD